MEKKIKIFSVGYLIESGRFHYLLALILVALIPLYFRFTPPFMILWGMLFLSGIGKKVNEIKNSPAHHKILFFLFLAYYFWTVAGITYSQNTNEGFRNLILRLPLLLFPLILTSPEEYLKNNTGKILRLFAICTSLFSVVCLFYATYRSISNINGTFSFNPHPAEYPWLNYYYATYFAIFQHPSYLSMYVLFSVFISFEEISKRVGSISKYFWIVISIILIASLYLLSSRAAFIASFISIPLYFIFKFKEARISWIWWITTFMIILGILISFFSNPRLQLILESENKQELINKTMHESRFGLWSAGLNIVRNNPVFGIGTGAIQAELDKEYLRMGDENLLKVKDLNTHNQFIETAAENGIISFILFILIFCSMFIISSSTRNILYLMFIIIILVSFTFEAMLNRLAGLLFFGFFSFILIHLNRE
jgi:O-antigen ligase